MSIQNLVSSPTPTPVDSSGPALSVHGRGRPDRGLASMLLAAIVSALVVAADSVVGSYADDHLLFGWIVLWAVGFAALALLAGSARDTADKLAQAFGNWAKRRAQRESDARLRALAEHDPRIMADIEAAITRTASASDPMDQALGRAWLDRHPVGTFNAAYAGPTQAFRTMPLTGLPTHVQYLPG